MKSAYIIIPIWLSLLPYFGNCLDERLATWFWSRSFQKEQVGPTEFSSTQNYKIAHNIWYHNGDFFAVTPNDKATLDSLVGKMNMSQNLQPILFPVKDVQRHYQNMQAGFVEGPTLHIDFTFTIDMGYWAEILLPVYSQLVSGDWKQHMPEGQQHIKAILFSNVERKEIQKITWIMEMIKLTVAPGLRPGSVLPRLLFFDELQNTNISTWLGFEHLIHFHSKYDHPDGRSGFYDSKHAHTFREAAYKLAKVPPLANPSQITLLMASGNPPIANNGAILRSLRQVAAKYNMTVRPYSASVEAPFTSHVEVAAKSRILVGRQMSLIADALFIPPNGGVLEFLPYNWEWKDVDEMYLKLTESMGDVHHVAWKPKTSDNMAFLTPEDARYGNWTAEECSSKHCLEVLERTPLRVDVDEMARILDTMLEGMEKGASPAETRKQLPWPPRQQSTGNTGLWWDVN